MSILVTCASGTLGSEIVKVLSENDFHIKAAVHTTLRAKNFDWSNVQVCEFNFLDKSLYESVLINVDTIILISPPISSNVDKIVLPFVKYAVKAGVKRIINISAMGVEFDKTSPLRKIENSIKRMKVEYTFIRPTWYMQNFNTRFLPMINKMNALVLPADDALVSFIDTRDIAELLLKVIKSNEQHKREYTLSGPESLTAAEIAKKISAVSGREINFINTNDEKFIEILISSGLSKEAAEYQAGVFYFIRQGMYSTVSPNILINLNHLPRNFDDYCSEYAHYWKI